MNSICIYIYNGSYFVVFHCLLEQLAVLQFLIISYFITQAKKFHSLAKQKKTVITLCHMISISVAVLCPQLYISNKLHDFYFIDDFQLWPHLDDWFLLVGIFCHVLKSLPSHFITVLRNFVRKHKHKHKNGNIFFFSSKISHNFRIDNKFSLS